MPPADLIPEVIRGIITYMNITNAAILYDETFSEYQKFHFPLSLSGVSGLLGQLNCFSPTSRYSYGSQVQVTAAEHPHPPRDHEH